MTRAEEAALSAYPKGADESHMCIGIETIRWIERRFGFQEGYEQAEKDTIERAISWIKKNTCMGVYEQELMRKELEDEK